MTWSKLKSKKTWLALIFLIVMLVVILPFVFYIFNPSVKLFRSVFASLPYPAVVIDGRNVVTTKALIADVDAARRYYETQDFASAGMRVDFKTKEGQFRMKIKEKDILDKSIEDLIIKESVEKYDITVSQKELDDELKLLAKKEGGMNSLEESLQKNYGWDLKYFRKKVVLNQVRLRKLIDYYLEEEKKSEKWTLIQEAENKIKNENLDFCEAVKNYSSEKEKIESCGEVGWFKRSDLEPEVAKNIFGMKEGDVSDVIKSSLGYHIVFLEEKRDKEQNGNQVEEVKLKQVFVGTGGFSDWIKQRKKEHKVWILIRDYEWNANEALVEFRSSNFKIKENDLRIKSEGDPMFY